MKKILITVALLMLASTLFGCKKDKNYELNVEYTKGPVSFKEVYGIGRYNNSKDLGTIANAEHITYYFASELTDAQIEEYVKETNQLIHQMEEELEIKGKKYDIYVCNVDYVTTVDEKTLYTTYSDFGTVEHVRGIAQLLCGNEVNYGLLYGYAASFAKEYDFNIKTDGLAEALKLRETNPEYLDMNYACFNEHYAEPENIEKLQVIAANYYAYLQANKKTEIVKDFSDEKHREYFNQFLAANGKEAYDNSDMEGIAIYAGGNGAELIWKDNVGLYYLEEGFEPNYLHGYFEEDPFNSGYENFRKLILDYQVQRQFLKDEFAEYNVNIEPVKIIFTKGGNYAIGGSGKADTYDDTILVHTPMNVQQHYVNKMLFQEGKSAGWVLSAVRTYYVYYPGAEDANFFVKWFQESVQEVRENPEVDIVEYELITQIEEQLGHPLDLSVRNDCIYYYGALAVQGGLAYMPINGEASFEQVSFVSYLMFLVGEENAISAILKDDAEDTFGKSWEELQDDWLNYIETTFSWMIE